MPPADESWRGLLVPGKRGAPEPNSLANVIILLTHSPKWKGCFAFDQFSGEIMVVRCPPWQKDSEFVVRRLAHYDIVMTAGALEYDNMNASVSRATDAIKAAAQHNTIHPVRDYFSALRWDGEPRLRTWLRDYLHADAQPAEYLQEVGTKWLVAGVQRIFRPGSKFDHMLVLEGTGGLGKSTALKMLATFGHDVEVEYFTDAIRFENIAQPGSIMGLQGKLIIEFAELAGMNRKETDDVKNWITIQIDELQMKYENAVTRFPRQFILAGTTNEEAWLRDATGNRRFLPVKCTGRVNFEGLKRDREQLWAEAVALYRQGYETFIPLGSSIEKLAVEEQATRLVEDVWTDQIMTYCNTAQHVTVNEVLAMIQVDPGRRDEVMARRVGRILRQAGWTRGQKWMNGTNKKIWMNPKYANSNPAETLPMPLPEAGPAKGSDWDFE